MLDCHITAQLTDIYVKIEGEKSIQDDKQDKISLKLKLIWPTNILNFGESKQTKPKTRYKRVDSNYTGFLHC